MKTAASLMYRGLIVSTCLAAVFTLGCANPQRPDPGEAFNELSKRSLESDIAYVRARLAPGLIEQAKEDGTDVEVDAFVNQIMSELQVCKSQGWEKTESPERVRIEAAGIKPGRVYRKHYDMIYDEKSGWLLATRAYDESPISGEAAGE